MRRATLLAALTCGLAVASLSEAAVSGWHVETVGKITAASETYYPYGDVAVVGNARGRRAVAWGERNGLHVAVAKPGHGFAKARLAKRERGYALLPRLAMNSRGDTLIVWNYFDRTHVGDPEARDDDDCCLGARVAVLRRDGHLSRVRTLTPRSISVSVAAYAIGPGGRYGVVWRESDQDSYYYYDDDPSGPARPGLLARFSGRRGLRPLQKVDRRGEGLVLAFVRGRPRVLIRPLSGRSRLVERIAHRNGRFGARRVVAMDLPDEPSVVAAANERGDEVVAWTNARGGHRLHAGTRAPGERLRQRTVARTKQYDAGSVAIARSGAAAVAWTPSSGGILLSTSEGRGHPFRSPSVVFPPKHGASVNGLELAVDSFRRAVVGWYPESYRRLTNFHAAIVDPAGRRERHVRFRGRESALLGVDTRAAFDDHGRATVAWVRADAVRAAQVDVDR